MRPETEEWIKQAEYDLDTAKLMYHGGRYIYTLFMCHLAIEKGLKAYLVESSGETPPRTHDLIILMKKGNPPLTDQQQETVSRFAILGVATRYPASLSRALKQFSKDVATEYLDRAQEVVECLQKGLLMK
jgi:HEPN domain-containing protein